MRLIYVRFADEQQLFGLLAQVERDPDVLDEAGLGQVGQYPSERLPVHLSVESLVLLVVVDQLVQLGRVVDDLVLPNRLQDGVRAAEATNLSKREDFSGQK